MTHNKIRCPKQNDKSKRHHKISTIGKLLFSCSCGEDFELTEKEVEDIYKSILNTRTKRIDDQLTFHKMK